MEQFMARAPQTPGHRRRVLLASDGSEPALRAVRYVIALRADLRADAPLDVHLVNVQRPVSRDVSRFVAGKTLAEYHDERSVEALAGSRALLAAAGVAFQEHRRVGDPGKTIADAAREQACDMIVMGSRGLGSHTGALLGSVAQRAVEHAGVPVLLVR